MEECLQKETVLVGACDSRRRWAVGPAAPGGREKQT